MERQSPMITERDTVPSGHIPGGPGGRPGPGALTHAGRSITGRAGRPFARTARAIM